MLSSEFEQTKRTSAHRITLRMPNSIFTEIRKEAELKDLPVNAVINKLLSKNTSYDIKFNVIPTITMSHVLFSKIVEEIDEQTIEKIASEGPDVVKKLFTLLGIPYTLHEVIESYFVTFGKYCGWYKFTYQVKNSQYRLVFETSLGTSWTKFLFLYVKNILGSLGAHIVNSSIHDNIILFEFKTSVI